MDNVNPSERIRGTPPPERNGAGGPAGDAGPLGEEAAGANRLMRNLFTMALVAACLALLVRHFGIEELLTIVVRIALVAIGLGLVIFIHELGHFLVAKWCDVHVEAFSIGFGPAIPGCSFRRGETVYKIAWFPLGGYVKMVGEGPEGDEGDDDPRSFKNKPVWQRMAIISAGVTMNVLFAGLCFIFVYMTHGVPQEPAEVNLVDSGGAAWQAGIPTGAVFTRIGKIDHPYFEDLLYQVVLCPRGHELSMTYETFYPPGKTRTYHVELEPRRDPDEMRPVIGVTVPSSLTLPAKPRGSLPLAQPGSPAAAATPPFEFGDTIVGTTDPDHPDQVTPLPRDPRNPERDQPDYFAFRRRLERLADRDIVALPALGASTVGFMGSPLGQGPLLAASALIPGRTDIVIQVRRHGADPNDPPVDIRVPAAWYQTFGLRMRIGKVTAVRHDSPAARAGILAPDPSKGVEGDLLDQVEVIGADGKRTRWVSSSGKPVPPGVTRKDLDPLRLPHELRQWAEHKQGERKVQLTVLRQVGHEERRPVTIEAAWDDHWRYDYEFPLSPNSPLPIPELGLAYRVETVVEAVQPNSPADRAGMQRGDLIKAIQFLKLGTAEEEPGKRIDLAQSDQWASAFAALHLGAPQKVKLSVEREGQVQVFTLESESDQSWPLADRGLVGPYYSLLVPETRFQRADGLGQAVYLGFQRTWRSIVNIVLLLGAIATHNVSAKAVGGPISIAHMAYSVAGQDIYSLILFLGIIGVNLAVFNFLPIPILDGGHMVFLLYEKISGVPPPESVRAIATYIGLLLILGLLVFVCWVDISRLLS